MARKKQNNILQPYDGKLFLNDGNFEGVGGEQNDDNPNNFLAENPPVDDSALFLNWLKWYHGESRVDELADKGIYGVAVYDYDGLLGELTPEIVKKAIEWAKLHSFDYKDLSPAHFVTMRDISEDEFNRDVRFEQTKKIESWKETLRSNRKNLEHFLLPTGDIRVHFTSGTIKSILLNGLIVGNPEQINHTTVRLVQYRPAHDSVVDIEIRQKVEEENLDTLSHPHHNQTEAIVIEFPQQKIKPERFVDPVSSFIIENIVFNKVQFVIDPQYIKGYIDLNTGQFHSKEEVL